MGNLKKAGRMGAKALLYFEIVTTFALLSGIVVAFLIKPGYGVNLNSVKKENISQYTKATISWAEFFRKNSTLQVLIVSVLIGIVLNFYKKRKTITDVFQWLAKYIFKVLHKVMLLAPIGAFGGMAYTISKYGMNTLLPLGKLMLTVYTTMAVFIFGVLWLLLKYYRVSIFKYLKYIR